MYNKRRMSVFKLLLLSIFVLALSTAVAAQGRGRGGGVGGGRSASPGGGRPEGVGVERGTGNASVRSEGRSDKGLSNASEKSNGRSDTGLERARMASSRLRDADKDLRDHPGVANLLHTNANSLRTGYQAALATNPDLKFGQYVAATRLGQNLNSRHPNITRDAILAGLNSDRSLGQTLQDLGLSDQEASQARKRAEREIKDARKN